MKTLLKNWKTTLGAVAIFACVGLYLSNYITGEQLTASVAVLAGAGFLAAKDGNKTGV